MRRVESRSYFCGKEGAKEGGSRTDALTQVKSAGVTESESAHVRKAAKHHPDRSRASDVPSAFPKALKEAETQLVAVHTDLQSMFEVTSGTEQQAVGERGLSVRPHCHSAQAEDTTGMTPRSRLVSPGEAVAVE